MGPKFSVNYQTNDFPIDKTIAEMEYLVNNMDLPTDDIRSELRAKLVTVTTSHLNNINKNTDSKTVYYNKSFQQTKKFLKCNPDIIIIEADKGNTTIAMNKTDYIKNMEEILSDRNKYTQLLLDPTQRLQLKNNALMKTLNEEKQIDDITKKKLTIHNAQCPRPTRPVKNDNIKPR